LGEVESILAGVEGIKSSMVASRRLRGGENYLAAYYVMEKGKKLDEENLKNILNASLPGYMIPQVFIPCEDFPLTPTGKIDRKRLPDPDETRLSNIQTFGCTYTPPRDRVEEKLVEIWKEILGVEIIGVGANFFRLGGHSLTATLLAARIFKEFQVKIPLPEVFRTPTIKDLSSYIIAAARDRYTPIKAREEKEYYPLSSGQKRLYVMQQMAADAVSYNISHVFLLEGDLEEGKVEGAFCGLIRRHESLRTSFHLVNEQPVQRIHDAVEFEIENYKNSEVEVKVEVEEEVPCGGCGAPGLLDACGEDLATDGTECTEKKPFEPKSQELRVKSYIKDFILPFDLSKAPLLRVGLIDVGDRRSLLVIDMHHIIADGMSLGIMAGNLMALYNGKTAANLSLRYRDYSQWQQEQKESGEIKEQEEFWLKEFQGELPVLSLPTDFKRPGLQYFEGGSWSFSLGEKDTEQLKILAAERDVTLFMVLLSLYNVWLARISTQEDIIVGTPTAGRRYPGIENIIGMFVNTLALRSYPVGEKTFLEFLHEVRQWTLAAFENQDYQFEDLVERLQQHRDSNRNPLFDVMFTFQNLSVIGMEIPGLTLNPYPYENQVSKFDLSLDVMDKEGRLAFTLHYSQTLFKKSTIERITGSFKNMVFCVLADPGKKLGSIDILTEAEKSELLIHFNDTGKKYRSDRGIKVWIEEQVEKTPRDIARN
jgi:acyl carrier protein